jgi:hypothetical protein
MKKILAIILLALSTTSMAHGYHGGHYYNNNQWVGPAVAGVVIGGLAARAYYAPSPVYVQQPQVVYVQPPVYYQQPNPAPSGYHQENILDANCNCYKTVLVPN